MRRLLALALSVQMIAGCAYVTGQVTERRKKHSTLYESKVEQRPIPDSKSVAVAGIVVEDRLEVATQHIDQCQITRIQTFKNEETVSYELPKWHWVTLTAGLALSGGGGAAWKVGNSKIPDQPSGQLINPTSEQDRDLGRVLVPMGMGMVAAGATMLLAEIFDLLLLGDEKVPLPDSQEQLAEGITRCQASPASFIEVIAKPARDPERRVTHVVLDTDEDGRAALPLLKSGLAHFPYGKPFLQLTCAACEPSYVHISAEVAAELILQSQRQDDVEGWMADHKGHPATPLMAKLLRELDADQARLRRVSPKVQIRKVEEYLWDNRFHEAWEAGHLCIRAHPRHGGCKRALTEAEGWYLEHLLKSVRNSLQWGEPQRALYAAKQCLVVKPGHGVCKRLKRKAERTWVKARRGLSYRVQEVAYRNGATQVVSEFKLKKAHKYVRLGISVYVNGRPACVDTREVHQITANEVIVHESSCPDDLERIDRVVLRVEDTKSSRSASTDKDKDEADPADPSTTSANVPAKQKREFEGVDPGDGVAPPSKE